MPTSTLTTKGQTTIPKRIREHLHLEPGDRIEFVIESENRVIVQSATMDVTSLDGLLDRSGRKPVRTADMDRAIEKEVSETYRRGK